MSNLALLSFKGDLFFDSLIKNRIFFLTFSSINCCRILIRMYLKFFQVNLEFFYGILSQVFESRVVLLTFPPGSVMGLNIHLLKRL